MNRFLALPSAFVQAGLLLSVCVLAAVCLIMNVTVTQEVEVMARAEAVLRQKLNSPDENPALPSAMSNAVVLPRKQLIGTSSTMEYPLDSKEEGSELEPLKMRSSVGAAQWQAELGGGRKAKGSGDDGGLYELREHAYQVSELCELFGGNGVRRMYDIVMVLYMMCTLWG